VEGDVGGVPEWAGWIGLVVLVGLFGVLAWWLLASRLPEQEAVAGPTPDVLRVRLRMAGVVLLSGVFLRVGAPWDELWHRLYGVPFGEDLLWPPHLLMYASIALTTVLVFFGLSTALGGRGGLRARLRREPLLGALGLLAAYGFAFIPVDVLWHALIGPDLMAESPPHVVGALSGTAVSLTGVALALSTAPRPAWRRLLDRPWTADLLVLGILAVVALNLLQLFTTSWDWADVEVLRGRPVWTFPVTVLVIGAIVSHLALHATRRIGAATAVALVVLLVHVPAVAAYRLLLPPGPTITAHLLLLPAVIALDAWYAWRTQDRGRPWTGALLYAAVLVAVALPSIGGSTAVPALGQSDILASVALGLPAGLIVGVAAAWVGAWLARVGRSEEPSADRGPEPRSVEPSGLAARRDAGRSPVGVPTMPRGRAS
jgi:hypothetical protein